MAQPKIKRAWVTNQNLSFVVALTFSSPSLGPVVCERACLTSGFLEISSAVSAVAIYYKFAPRDPFDCRGRQDSGERTFLRGLNPTSQYFSHAPSLCDATTGEMRITRIKHFANGADSVVVEVLRKGSEKFPGAGLVFGMYF